MKSIALDAFLQFKFLGNLKVAKDEKIYGFVAAKANLEDNTYHYDLYIGSDEKPKKVLSMKKNSGFIFLDDNRLLLDLQKTKKEQKDLKDELIQSYYMYDLSGKQLKKAFKLPFKAEIEAVLDNEVLLLSSNMDASAHILYEGTKAQRDHYLKEQKKEELYVDIDELPYHFNGSDFIQGIRKQLFLFDLKTETIKRILDKDFALETFLLSENKDKIFYAGKMHEKIRTFTSDIYAYDIASDQHEIIYGKRNFNIVKLSEVNHQLIVAAKDMKDYGLNQNPDFFMLKEGELKLLAKFGESIGNTIGTDCRLPKTEQSFVKHDTLYFVTTIDDHNEIMSLDLKGNLQSVYRMKGGIDGLISYQDQALIIGMKDQKLQELYRWHLTSSDLKQVTRLNASVLSGAYVAKPKTVIVKKPNHDVKGFVLLPKDYNPQKTYPAILDIHGGPKTVYGQVYYHEMQYWANEGYIVFFANPRGSDGKGDQFADIRGKYGTIDYEDLMDFTDLVLKKYPAIDKTHLYVTGGSYGGFMTNWIIGHTDRFKAAATQRSISNWMSFYGTSDIGFHFGVDQTAGHPVIHMEKLYNQSPIKYVMQVKTPLLFIHSDKDHRCPMEQAQQFYALLKTQGLDTKLVWIKNENHELSRSGKPQARIKRLKEITEWFKTHA